MSEHEALGASIIGARRGGNRPPRSSCVDRITVPFSIAITALGLAAGAIIVMRFGLTQMSCAGR